MIFLFTDFGPQGLYTGQVEAVVRRHAPAMAVINVLSDAPVGDPRRSGYLLAALALELPTGSVFLSVVDPGVGGDRLPVVLGADGRWFVGPDNGLFDAVARQSRDREWRVIDWRPERLSGSFHGRDLFAPIAARIALGDFGWSHRRYAGPDLAGWPADLFEVIYVDHYGNAITGVRHGPRLDGRILTANGCRLPQAGTFCEVPEGAGFWYRNSIGLVEIAVNRGRADGVLGLSLGALIHFE